VTPALHAARQRGTNESPHKGCSFELGHPPIFM